jgi:hypothetical protein
MTEFAEQTSGYFCMFENQDCTSSRAEIRSAQPEPVIEPPGWVPRYVVLLGDDGIEGAQILLRRMDREFSEKRIGHGQYRIPYQRARRWIDERLLEARAPLAAPQKGAGGWSTSSSVRVVAGVAGIAIGVAYVAINFYITILWILYITVRRRRSSALTTMLEARVLFAILDLRPTVRALVGIALQR